MSDGECDDVADWKDQRKFRPRTGSLLEAAAVLKGLLGLDQAKALSFREKKMLEQGALPVGQRTCDGQEL